jgi:spore germination cell wall hydrolase CwlJ-like protein
MKITKIVLKGLIALLITCVSTTCLANIIKLENTIVADVHEIRTEKNIVSDTIRKQLECLTNNIYREAAGEPFEGKVGVAQVTINRVNDGGYPDSVCDVVHQRTVVDNGRIVCQFSWLCQRHRRKIDLDVYRECQSIAVQVLLKGYRIDKFKNALFYHATGVHPVWRKKLIMVSRTGHHYFYKQKTYA